MIQIDPFAAVTRTLARGAPLTEVLTALHERIVEASGAISSVVIHYDPRVGAYVASSGVGVPDLGGSWLSGSEARTADGLLRSGAPARVAELATLLPHLASRLGAPAGVLVPLSPHEQRVDVLVVGLPSSANLAAAEAAGTAAAEILLLARELIRLRRGAEFQPRLRALMLAFGRSLSSTLNLSVGLDALCHDATALFGAGRTAVWRHDRRAHQLVLLASSDPPTPSDTPRVATDDLTVPAAYGMRREGPEFLRSDRSGPAARRTMTVPLRGRRRALGTIVFDDLLPQAPDMELLEHAGELG
ncbi:MAG: hypothetical protein LC804_24170, partial [Acidobacteria bacterium]|nr:hypothetical protein [Acidobacteriota bacterium]